MAVGASTRPSSSGDLRGLAPKAAMANASGDCEELTMLVKQATQTMGGNHSAGRAVLFLPGIVAVIMRWLPRVLPIFPTVLW